MTLFVIRFITTMECPDCGSPVASKGRDSVKFECKRWMYFPVGEQLGERSKECFVREAALMRGRLMALIKFLETHGRAGYGMPAKQMFEWRQLQAAITAAKGEGEE